MGKEIGHFPASEPSFADTIDRLLKRKSVLILYIDECRKKEDWHGVRDAATDIEVCLAELGAYQARQHELELAGPERTEILGAVL